MKIGIIASLFITIPILLIVISFGMNILNNKKKKMKLSNVSHSQLSIVRHYGACIINGKEYIYNSVTDELDLKVKVKKSNEKPYISNQLKIDL